MQQQRQQPPMLPQQQSNPQQAPFPKQPYQPPKAPKRKWYQQLFAWCRRHPIATAVFLVVFLVIGAVSYLTNLSHPSTTTQTTQQTQGTQSTHITQQPTLQPTSKPTPKPTVQPTKGLAITHGTPHIGGPMSDFYGKYGQQNNQGIGNSQTWIVDQQHQILVNATPNASGEVTGVTVTSGSNWSDSQTKTYCSQFLPSDASAFNSVSNFTDYHSSIVRLYCNLSLRHHV